MTAIAIPVNQRTPEWLEARENGIGGSEAAAAIGLSPWESPYGLWCRKLHLVPPVEQTPAMLLGELLEPVLAELYERQTGETLRRRNQLLQHPEHPWMLASLDRVRPGRRLVELKSSARGTGYGEPGTDEVPDEVLVQVVHQMAVMDAPEADVAVLVGGSAPIRIYTVRRDLDAEAVLIERERAFWRSVETRTEPALDGSESTLRALRERYPRETGEVVTAGPDVAEALALLGSVRQAIETHEANEKRLRAVIEAAMGEAAELVAPGVGRVSWKAPKDTVTTDWKAVAAEFREQLLESGLDPEVVGLVENAHTTTKPASRRFVPRWEDA